MTRTILRFSAQLVDARDPPRDGFVWVRTAEGEVRLATLPTDLELLVGYDEVELVALVVLDRVGAIVDGTILEVRVDETRRREASGVVRRRADDAATAASEDDAEDDLDDAFERIRR